jgi:peptidyl-prolyl cis-trans isomerase SurA
VAAAFRRYLTRTCITGATIALGIATSAPAQDQASQPAPPVNSTESLKLPQNPEIFGAAMPSVIKATAIVNGEVITQTDVEQRLGLLAIANGGEIPNEEADRLRQQVLRNLIDETLEIQAAKAEKITIKPSDIDKAVVRVAANVKQTPAELTAYLGSHGSDIVTLRRQIEGELAWRRLQSAKIESGISVGDDEVKAVLDRLNAAKGSEE